MRSISDINKLVGNVILCNQMEIQPIKLILNQSLQIEENPCELNEKWKFQIVMKCLTVFGNMKYWPSSLHQDCFHKIL